MPHNLKFGAFLSAFLDGFTNIVPVGWLKRPGAPTQVFDDDAEQLTNEKEQGPTEEEAE